MFSKEEQAMVDAVHGFLDMHLGWTAMSDEARQELTNAVNALERLRKF